MIESQRWLRFCFRGRFAYWPKQEAVPNSKAWEESVQQFERDLKAMQELVAKSDTDLYAKIEWGSGQTLLREALLLADHNAYHVAQLVAEAEAERGAGLPLRLGNRQQRAAPDLAEEGAGIDRQRGGRQPDDGVYLSRSAQRPWRPDVKRVLHDLHAL